MLKILVLDGGPGQDLSESHRQTMETMCQKLTGAGNFKYVLAAIQRLVIVIKDQKIQMLVDGRADLKDFQFVLFRNANVNRDLAAAVTLYLKHESIPYANGVEGSGSWVGKIAQMVLYCQNGIPVPDTVCVRNHEDLMAAAQANFSKPYVLKDNLGLAGRRNYLIESDSQAAHELEDRHENYIVQAFIPNDGDYRVLFAGTDRPPLIFKRTRAAGSHLNNTSQGGSAQVVTDFPDAALATARAAAKLFERELAGVDILFDDQGNHFVLEVNETPAIASGFMPETKMDLLHKYISSVLES